jgi:hypothetical protein
VNRSDRCGHPGHPGQGSRSALARVVRQSGTVRVHRTRTGIGSMNRRDGQLPVVLGHDRNAQRFNSSAALTQSGSIFGCHRHGWLLLLQRLHRDIRPSSAQHILHPPPIDSLMRDHHQRGAVATDHSCEADIAPSPAATRHPVSNVTQPTPQPSYSVGQASRRIDPHDGEARCCCCRPLRHAAPPRPDHRSSAPYARGGSAGERPAVAIVRDRRADMQRPRRPARSTSSTSVRATMTSCWVAYIVAIW